VLDRVAHLAGLENPALVSTPVADFVFRDGESRSDAS
jgi:hypothetical protein